MAVADTPELEITFLGTATSVGVPAIGCDCATCHSEDPRDKRLRSSIYVRTPEAAWVVDTGPDFRTQCLRENIRHLDAAIYTHPHMDHLAGFDELRRFCLAEDAVLPIYALPSCLAVLERMFQYAFNGQNRYRGYLKPESRMIDGPFFLGETQIVPLPVRHGKVETIGFLFRRGDRKLCAYLSDIKEAPPETIALMKGVDTLVVDALRHTEHPTHMSIQEALAFRLQVEAKRTWFTHFQCEVMHARDEPQMPADVRFAYDGLKLTW